MPFRSAFFAFPDRPAELKNPILAAVEIVKSKPDLRIQSWPQLDIFGAAIPDEVRGTIEKTDKFPSTRTIPLPVTVAMKPLSGPGLPGRKVAPRSNQSRQLRNSSLARQARARRARHCRSGS